MSSLYYSGVDAFTCITENKVCKVPGKVGEDIQQVESTLDLFVYSKLPDVFTWFAKGFRMKEAVEIFPEVLQVNQVQIRKSEVFGLSTSENKLYKVILKYRERYNDTDLELSDITPAALLDSKASLVQIAANDESLFVLDDNSGIYKWPKLLFRCEEIKIVRISCGFDHVLVLSDTGAVYSFGNGSRGQLGYPDIVLRSDKPIRIEFFDDLPSTIQSIACGGWHSLALTSDGDLYTFGWNTVGQLGHSSDPLLSVVKDPYPVDLGSKENPIVAVCAGARHSVALLKNGDLYAWGWNKYYQLGTGDDVDRPAPTPVAKFGAQKPCEIAPGRWGTFIFCEYEAV